MLRSIPAILIAGFLAASSAAADTPTLATIQSEMEAAWKRVSSLTGDIVMDFVMPFGEKPLALTGTGTLNILREDGKDKFRKTITSKLPEPFAMEMKVDVLYDGKKMITTTELMGQAETQEGEPSLRQGALPPGGPALLESMQQHLDLTVLPSDKIDGAEVFVLEGRAKDPDIPFSKVVFYIDRALGIQRKTEIYQPDGTIGITERIGNIQQDTKPDPALFRATK